MHFMGDRQVIFERELNYRKKKAKWKRVICRITCIHRIEDVLFADVIDLSSKSTIEQIQIYGYECGTCDVGFVIIGRSECYILSFDNGFAGNLELKGLLEKYILDTYSFLQLSHCSETNTKLHLNEWYTFHVQGIRICLTEFNKLYHPVEIWYFADIRNCEFDAIHNILRLTINVKKDAIDYSFTHNDKNKLSCIFEALKKVKKIAQDFRNGDISLKSQRSGSIEFHRYNSYSHPPNGLRKNSRLRSLSSNGVRSCFLDEIYSHSPASASTLPTNSFNTTFFPNTNDTSLPEEDLIFNFDQPTMEFDETVRINHEKKISENSNSTEICDDKSKRLVILEKRPYEADGKKNSSPKPDEDSMSTSTRADSHGHFSFKPNNVSYQAISMLRSKRKTLSDATVSSTLEPLKQISLSKSSGTNKSESSLYNDHTTASSSSTPATPSSTISPEMLPCSLPNEKMEPFSYPSNQYDSYNKCTSDDDNYYNLVNIIPIPKGPYHYYNISDHVSPEVKMYSRNDCKSPDSLHSDETKEMDHYNYFGELTYAELDFSDFHISCDTKKHLSSTTDYKIIDVQGTESLANLDDFLQKKSTKLPKKKKPSFLKSMMKRL